MEILRWTSVTSDNKLLGCLLGRYLLYSCNVILPLPKDIFLQDMAVGRTNYCSSPLVNAVLAEAIHECLLTSISIQTTDNTPNRTKSWIPQSLLYEFLAESKRLGSWNLSNTAIAHPYKQLLNP